jgi:hypothetical protein
LCDLRGQGLGPEGGDDWVIDDWRGPPKEFGAPPRGLRGFGFVKDFKGVRKRCEVGRVERARPHEEIAMSGLSLAHDA